jgi:hypothetical protein
VFVSLGLGSVIASTFEAAPWLMAVGRHKAAMFVAAGAMLGINYWLAIVRPRQGDCAPGEICHIDSPAMRVNRILFWASLVIWAGAVTFTYAASWWVRLQS